MTDENIRPLPRHPTGALRARRARQRRKQEKLECCTVTVRHSLVVWSFAATTVGLMAVSLMYLSDGV